MKDVLYACQGVNGKFTSYQSVPDTSKERFVVSPLAELTIADSELMSSLTELGFLFK